MPETPEPKGFDWKPSNAPLGPDPREDDSPLHSGEREAFAEIESQLADDPAIPNAPGQGRQEDVVADDAQRAIDHGDAQYIVPPEDQV